MKTYLIDLKVRTNYFNPDWGLRLFLESKGIEVLSCNGYEDPDGEEN